MKLPRVLNIFGLKVKLLVSLKIPPNIAGQYDHDKKLISLNHMHESDRELLHTLLHECGHAMFYRVSIQQAVSWEVHEFIVNNFATMLLENFEIKPRLKK
jgi:Zn-dependent peptidase ImmA (M78 family)